jgi:uncharacterized membrane protein
MKQVWKYLNLFMIGGGVYLLIELLYRGYTHWTMYMLGGICFISLGLLNEFLSWETPLWLQVLIGSIIVTILEFIAGCILNLWLGLNVWDYSDLPFNILGQICPQFTFLWLFISSYGIILDDFSRYGMGEEKPRYKLF